MIISPKAGFFIFFRAGSDSLNNGCESSCGISCVTGSFISEKPAIKNGRV